VCDTHDGTTADPADAVLPLFLLVLGYAIGTQITLTLAVVISFRNLANGSGAFWYVRLVGTFGWVVAGFVTGWALNPISPQPLYLAAGTSAALAAFALVLTTNAATIAASFAALAITLAYPYAKRFVSMPQAVLGVAFSVGILMAFTAVRGHGVPLAEWAGLVPAQAWLLLLGNLFWVLAYDTEYAMVDRDDDLKIGMKTSAITLGHRDVPAIMLFYMLYLAITAVALAPQHLGWPLWLALLVAAAQVAWHFRLIRHRTREGCFQAFRSNHWLGATVFAGIVLGTALR
ncbi:MAG TPA: UbiA family prenyltransferase, partial [Burkholderiaceae bacterium]